MCCQGSAHNEAPCTQPLDARVQIPTHLIPLPPSSGEMRLCVVHQNVAGELGKITSFIGDQQMNLIRSLDKTANGLAYTVMDFSENVADPKKFQVRACQIILQVQLAPGSK